MDVFLFIVFLLVGAAVSFILIHPFLHVRRFELRFIDYLEAKQILVGQPNMRRASSFTSSIFFLIAVIITALVIAFTTSTNIIAYFIGITVIVAYLWSAGGITDNNIDQFMRRYSDRLDMEKLLQMDANELLDDVKRTL